jgi:hypothetical protein
VTQEDASLNRPPGGSQALPPALRLRAVAGLPRWVKAALALLVVAAFFAVGYLASRYYPHERTPTGSELERRIASAFSIPRATADDRLVGDLLVERFYAVDIETGERYVADMLKGRIQDLQPLPRDDGSTAYSLVLDLRNLQRDRALYAAFVDAVARPSQLSAEYLGLRAFAGDNDAFAFNYDGNLPEARRPFQGPNGEDAYRFLLSQSAARVTASPSLIRIEGYSYLLSSTDLFSYFRAQFGVRALLLSELLIVDATGRPQASLLLRLQQELPRLR